MYIVYCKAHHTENVCKAKILLQLATLLEPPYAKNNSSYGCFFFFWFFVFPSSFFACRTPRWKTLKLPPDVALKSQRTFASFPCDLRIFATIICLNLFHWKRMRRACARTFESSRFLATAISLFKNIFLLPHHNKPPRLDSKLFCQNQITDLPLPTPTQVPPPPPTTKTKRVKQQARPVYCRICKSH